MNALIRHLYYYYIVSTVSYGELAAVVVVYR